MIKDFIRITFRNLKKNKGFAFLNMVGLALGMASAVFILLWVNDELQYNRFQKNYDRLYMMMENQNYDGKIYTFSAMPGPFVPAIKQEVPEVEYAARADWGNRVLFTLGEKSIYEEGRFTEPDFLRMFSVEVLKGDTTGALTDPSSLIITDEMAEKFFGKSNPVGQTLKVNNDKSMTIRAVVKKFPNASTIRFSWLAPYKIHEDSNEWLKGWGSNGIINYVQLKRGTSREIVDRKFHDFIQKKDTGAIAKPFLFAMNDWRLRNDFENGKQTGRGRIEYVRLFSIIGLLIILIACINFMNLATARSEQRAREVGVRKVMGAGKGALIRQFMGESMVMAFAAMLIAVLLVVLLLPLFNTLVEKKLSFDFSNRVFWAGFPLLAIFCGIIAGSYPSIYLSSFNPTTVFKGIKIGKNSIITNIRKGLVVTQFVISIALIICTIIIYKQIEHVKDRQLGYSKDHVLYLELQGKLAERFATVRNELLATGMVENVAASNNRVLEVGSSSSDFEWEGKNPQQKTLISMEWTNQYYISTMGIKIVQGRDFHPDGVSDSSSMIINETFAKIIGKPNPVGTIIRRDDGKTKTIIGVVKDYIFNDMYKKPDPLALFYNPKYTFTMLIRLKAEKSPSAALAQIERVVKSNNPGYPFEYRFLDEDFNNQFKSEMLIGKLSRIFSLLTIVISCLGLFGLAAYTAERRTREIGIRKVLGASVSNLVTLLSKDFLKLVGIATIVAFPLAWWVMYEWLQDYSYRISIQWWYFAVAGILAIVVALLTVSFQAIKAAFANPVKSLRTE